MRWSNWSGLVKAEPARMEKPETEAQLADLVKQCAQEGKTLRPVGAGHSFTPLAATDQVLLSLDAMSGLISVDSEKKHAEVFAGTRLKALGELLYSRGLAMENLGDIDVQSIAGAAVTGTHGTGPQFGIIATQIEGLTLIDGKGDLITCSADENPELFRAARVSLGALGVITRVRLKLLPAYRLRYTSKRAGFFETLERMDSYADRHRNFEFYWFPHSDRVQLKLTDRTEDTAKGAGLTKQLNDLILENGAFWVLSQMCRFAPSLCAPVSKLCAALISEGSRVDWSHRIFATQRLVKFQEMEYNIPRQNLAEALRAVHAKTAERNYRVHFPIEVRFVAADDIMLSPANGRESAYVAVHMFKGMPFETYFREIEEIFLSFDGRPHWGKWHSLAAPRPAPKYPRWQDFQDLRAAHDPGGVFLNPYLKNLFGLD
ncbi:MAG: D-arabinono-1,4-lactone oxidase [Acidobacteriota bacterium]|nr:D-arabinono-1,4-lactone oxidase [Acidobacteriota bacterium]